MPTFTMQTFGNKMSGKQRTYSGRFFFNLIKQFSFTWTVFLNDSLFQKLLLILDFKIMHLGTILHLDIRNYSNVEIFCGIFYIPTLCFYYIP